MQQEEFINGSALRLECNCRGDLALRHRDCVMKWVQVKGSNVSATGVQGVGQAGDAGRQRCRGGG